MIRSLLFFGSEPEFLFPPSSIVGVGHNPTTHQFVKMQPVRIPEVNNQRWREQAVFNECWQSAKFLPDDRRIRLPQKFGGCFLPRWKISVDGVSRENGIGALFSCLFICAPKRRFPRNWPRRWNCEAYL